MARVNNALHSIYTPVGPRYLEWGRIKTFRE